MLDDQTFKTVIISTPLISIGSSLKICLVAEGEAGFIQGSGNYEIGY
jgi:3'-phosphoadenosine 5'-phosphosulfate (PAPS) 3'-phosphatase